MTKLRVILLILIIFVLVAPVYAHGLEHENVTDIERVISGFGIIAITIAGAYTYLTGKADIERRKRQKQQQAQNPSSD